MAFGEETLLDDHSDTRSGVCGITFTWSNPDNDGVTSNVPFMGSKE